MSAAGTILCPHCSTPCDEQHKYCAGCGFPIGEIREETEDPLIGQTLPGGHVVLELIDVGGMGRVYRAEQRMLGRTVAVKIIHPHLLGDETVEARFITEARAASQLNHPNSVSVIDFGKADVGFYLVMEYLRGRELAAVVRDDGPFEPARIVEVLGQVLDALEEAHHLGIVHRDLKPENIILQSMRSGGDFVKVIDFGLAKVREAALEGRITNPGMVCGTPQYMAPEQARGDPVDARTDLYACGIVLYEMLTGMLPFEAQSPNEIVAMQLNDPPPDPRELLDDGVITSDTVDLLYRALAKQPTERFQSAAEFKQALSDTLLGPTLTGRPSGDLVRCPSCQSLVERRQKFCGECGSPMRLATSPPVLGVAAPPAPRIEQLEPPKPSLPFPLVGRDDELGWLCRARDELGSTLFGRRVIGKAGAGKTRLLAEFATRLTERGDLVAALGPDAWRASTGYATIREAIVRLADLPAHGGDGASWTGASPEARAGLGAVFGALPNREAEHRHSWSDTPPIHLKSSNRRFLVAEALRWALSRAQHRAGDGCVTVLLDDLDAIDGASRNAFADVVAEPPLGAVLLVAAHEPGFDPGWSDGDERSLGGLQPHQVATLVEHGPPLSLPPRPSGDGNGDGDDTMLPLYVEQLARLTAEGGIAEPPERLADLIALRIDRLAPDARRVLQAVAVLGDRASEAQLGALLPEVEQPSAQLSALDEAGLTVRHADGIAVAHPFAREVTLVSIPAEVRRRLHGRARTSPTGRERKMSLEAQALHAFYAQESFEALMLLEQAAACAAERADFDGAVRILRLGLDLARREMSRGSIEDPLSAILLFSCKLGDALALDGRLWDADGVLREALDLGGPRAEARPRILVSLANVAHERGRDETAVAYVTDALRIATDQGRLDWIASFERMRRQWSEAAPAQT